MNTVTKESFTGSNGEEVTEYKFSDGARFVKTIKHGETATGKASKTTTVVRADFEGDKEHPSTQKALLEALNNAVDAADAEAEAPATPAPAEAPSEAAASAEGQAEAEAPAPEATLDDYTIGEVVLGGQGVKWTILDILEEKGVLRVKNENGRITFRFPNKVRKIA